MEKTKSPHSHFQWLQWLLGFLKYNLCIYVFCARTAK